jgi:hypothetical protein
VIVVAQSFLDSDLAALAGEEGGQHG